MISSRLRRASESFWVLPTLLGLLAVVLAEVVLAVDRRSVGDGWWIFADLSATGSRALLTTVGGSMLGVAATSFSITISVLATTSSTYGPRLVRNFMADRGNQLVLAVLTSSFVYCLVVLRAVRSNADGVSVFVPTVAVHVAVVIALADVAVLVYFIHHIASSVQVTSLQQRVARELDAVVESRYPDEACDAAGHDLTCLDGCEDWPVVRATTSGYVQQVDVDSLVRWAHREDQVVEVVTGPGAHVVVGDVVARTARAVDPDAEGPVRRAVALGPARTPHQDVGYAVQQLTEMAVRALSPGTNDPYTAIGALEAVTPGLVTLATRPCPPAAHLDADGRPRVVLRPPPVHELVPPVLAAIRAWGLDHAIVVLAAVELSRRLLEADADRGTDGRLAATLGEEVAALVDRYEAGQPHPLDAARVRRATAGLPLSARPA